MEQSLTAIGTDACGFNPSLLENLKRQKQNLEGQLDKVNTALKALEENPEVAKVVEAISKIQRIY